jgi:hypothetical protein
MLRHEELNFIKAISTLQLSPALLKNLRMALSSLGRRSQWCLTGAAESQPKVG